jgi:Eukaryotic elongation factor 5A hypusine, DNA-binding OB fold
MDDAGTTKDDVKLPDGETGDKITKLFTEDGKDTSKFWFILAEDRLLMRRQMSLS